MIRFFDRVIAHVGEGTGEPPKSELVQVESASNLMPMRLAWKHGDVLLLPNLLHYVLLDDFNHLVVKIHESNLIIWLELP